MALVFLGVARSAGAQSADAAADALFEQGRDLVNRGRLEEACSAFEASQKIDPSASTALHLADCRERTGKLATAWALFLDAARRTRDQTDATATQLHDIATARATKLEARLSTLEIDVGAHSAGFVITRDHVAIDVAILNHRVPVDGGTYAIEATAPGFERWSTTITIAPEGDAKKVDVPPLLPSAKQPDTAPQPRPLAPGFGPMRTSERIGLGVMGGGAAIAIAGFVVGGLAISKWHDATAICGAKLACDNDADLSRALAAGDSAHRLGNVSTALVSVGAAGAVAGLALWWFERHQRHREHERPVAVVPRIDATQAGLELHVVF